MSRASIRICVGSELFANFTVLLLGNSGLGIFGQGDASVLAIVMVLVLSLCAAAFVPKHALSKPKHHHHHHQQQQQQSMAHEPVVIEENEK